MTVPEKPFHLVLCACWLAIAVSALVLVYTHMSPVGWDLHVYTNAMRSLHLRHDPYADGIAVQRAFHGTAASRDENVMPPYTYVYSPLTLPFLALLNHLPVPAIGIAYWLLYAASVVAAPLVCLRAAEPAERRTFAFFAALSPFFPGLLQTNVLLSGNVVYLLYAAILCCTWLGCRHHRWLPFYAIALLASCVKAPLLTLLLIPVLCSLQQWKRTALTAAIGCVAFAIQPLLWPTVFRNYLQAVNLQFVFNHDFGFSPSGLLGDILYQHGHSYTLPSTFFYLAYATAVLASLLYLARLHGQARLPLSQWMPLMLIGVVLLNPRIKEYDVAPLSLPMAMVLWRLLSQHHTWRRTAITFGACFLALNGFTIGTSAYWKPLEGALLLGLYSAGFLQAVRRHSNAASPVASRFAAVPGHPIRAEA